MKKKSKQVSKKQESTRAKDRATNMEEITQMGLEHWQDGFWDKYSSLPTIYKLAAAFFIMAGILAVITSFALFPVTEPFSDASKQIIGIFLLAFGSLLALITALGHYFHIRSVKGKSGLDEEIALEVMNSKSKKLNKSVKEDSQCGDQKKSHKNTDNMSVTENSSQSIQKSKHKSDATFETPKPKKKKSKENKSIKPEDIVIKSDAPPAPLISAPLEPSVFIPMKMPNETKSMDSANNTLSADSGVPIFSQKLSSNMQAKCVVLAGLFKSNRNPLPKSMEPLLVERVR